MESSNSIQHHTAWYQQAAHVYPTLAIECDQSLLSCGYLVAAAITHSAVSQPKGPDLVCRLQFWSVTVLPVIYMTADITHTAVSQPRVPALVCRLQSWSVAVLPVLYMACDCCCLCLLQSL